MTAPVKARGVEVLRAARAGGYALAAFNAMNLETAQAIVRAAEARRAPVILQISQNAARHGGLRELAALATGLRERAAVPVLVHFDHAEDAESARQALELGFDGVMLEGDDPDVLRGLAGLAHARGAYLEAEYEVVAKGEREAEPHADLGDLPAFVTATGCDLLAVNIGSAHKQTVKSTHLDFGRLARIAALTALPLVLHGASGVPEEELRRAAGSGVAKVNLATDLALRFTRAVQGSLSAGGVDPRQYLGAGRDAMQARAEQYIELLGSAGRA